MTAMQFSCPHCSGLFQVDATFGGQQITCPHCRGVVALPAMGPPTTTGPSYPQPYGGQPAPSVGPAAPTHSAQTPGGIPGSGPPPERKLTPPSQPVPAPTGPQQPAQFRTQERPLRPVPVQPSPPQPHVQRPQVPATPERPVSGPPQSRPVGPLPAGPQAPTVPPGHVTPGGASGQKRPPTPTPMRPVPVPTSAPKPTPKRPATIDARQSTGTAAGSTGQQAAPRFVPAAAPQRASVPTGGGVPGQGDAAKPISVSTGDAGLFNLREPVKTVGVGDDAIELKPLSPEEKARRRLKKNILLWGIGLAVIGITIAVLLMSGPIRF